MANHPPADLASRIADLQSEFQCVANLHSWMCLDIPPLEGNNGLPIAGPPGERHLVLDHVRQRLDPMRLPVLDQVNDLTRHAQQLLMQVLGIPNSIPIDIQTEIREWEDLRSEYGWIRWLWYATPMHYVGRIMNYPQVAANALRVLKDHVCVSDDGQEKPRLTWQETAKRLERLRSQGEPFTSQGRLAEQFGCSSGTINKAVQKTPSLQAWAKQLGATPKAESINDVVMDRTAQRREPNPVDDAAVREFIERADSETRAWFLALSPEDQIEFVNDPDKHQKILGRTP